MELVAVVTVGCLVAIGVWLMLDRNLVRVVLGVVVIGNAANMLLMTAGRLGLGTAAFVDGGAAADAANPLPQALVLTAIVIGFGLFAFALVVLKRVRETHGTTDTDRVTAVSEQASPDASHGPEGRGVP